MQPPAPPDELAIEFVCALLSIGSSMSGAVDSLIDSSEGQDLWPGEEPRNVIVEMAVGSILPALRRVPPEDLERATDLINAAGDRFMADLKLAMEIAERRESMRTR